jgi:hypothetical protein
MSIVLSDTEIERGTAPVREITSCPICPLRPVMIAVMESERVESRIMDAGHADDAALRPAVVCRQLLQATDASEGRRKRRKRDTTPDSLGMEVKRALLEAVVSDDPDPDLFEAWLFARVQASGTLAGATRAMALQVWDEWQFARASGGFRAWLAAGAPSDDSRAGTDMGLDPRG